MDGFCPPTPSHRIILLWMVSAYDAAIHKKIERRGYSPGRSEFLAMSEFNSFEASKKQEMLWRICFIIMISIVGDFCRDLIDTQLCGWSRFSS